MDKKNLVLIGNFAGNLLEIKNNYLEKEDIEVFEVGSGPEAEQLLSFVDQGIWIITSQKLAIPFIEGHGKKLKEKKNKIIILSNEHFNDNIYKKLEKNGLNEIIKPSQNLKPIFYKIDLLLKTFNNQDQSTKGNTSMPSSTNNEEKLHVERLMGTDEGKSINTQEKLRTERLTALRKNEDYNLEEQKMTKREKSYLENKSNKSKTTLNIIDEPKKTNKNSLSFIDEENESSNQKKTNLEIEEDKEKTSKRNVNLEIEEEEKGKKNPLKLEVEEELNQDKRNIRLEIADVDKDTEDHTYLDIEEESNTLKKDLKLEVIEENESEISGSDLKKENKEGKVKKSGLKLEIENEESEDSFLKKKTKPHPTLNSQKSSNLEIIDEDKKEVSKSLNIEDSKISKDKRKNLDIIDDEESLKEKKTQENIKQNKKSNINLDVENEDQEEVSPFNFNDEELEIEEKILKKEQKSKKTTSFSELEGEPSTQDNSQDEEKNDIIIQTTKGMNLLIGLLTIYEVAHKDKFIELIGKTIFKEFEAYANFMSFNEKTEKISDIFIASINIKDNEHTIESQSTYQSKWEDQKNFYHEKWINLKIPEWEDKNFEKKTNHFHFPMYDGGILLGIVYVKCMKPISPVQSRIIEVFIELARGHYLETQRDLKSNNSHQKRKQSITDSIKSLFN